jgi:nucleotide-binding universal stress UspA family protein
MRILLAIDDSKFSEAAAETVIEQARPHGTEVRILHVVESPPLLVARELGGYEPALENALQSQKQHAETLVAKAAELLRARGLNVTAALEMGDAKSKILDVAEEWHADLIVLGSHGRKGLNRFLMGGVSDAVTRHACCSVEIVRICPANAKN